METRLKFIFEQIASVAGTVDKSFFERIAHAVRTDNNFFKRISQAVRTDDNFFQTRIAQAVRTDVILTTFFKWIAQVGSNG